MLGVLRRILFGSPIPSWRAVHERLPKILALPIFASDALSSVAYATEEILLVLVLAGTQVVASPYLVGISIAIVCLLAIVATSYTQTIHAYPSGGGAYIVAKDNLGDTAGLTAGAALTIDYILTVAVSISSGVAAIISVHPFLQPHAVQIALAAILIITWGNLRGVRESGLIFALPTYVFITSAFVLIAYGLFRVMTSGIVVAPPIGTVPEATHQGVVGLGLAFLILRGFSSGCTAMTGTEAISNAVQAFRPPEAKNASRTLAVMAIILGAMFLGMGILARTMQVIPVEFGRPGYETVISQIAGRVFGDTRIPWFHNLIQYATALILFLAANTSYAGFPRLASIMARDRFFPRQFYNLGDRLVFSNGIMVLTVMASVLVVAFKANTTALIPLYAVGVFLSFTLSQYGMAKRFTRLKESGWHLKTFVSGLGAAVTGIVTLVIVITKFPIEGWWTPERGFQMQAGAWVVILLIWFFVTAFWKIHKHYISLGNQLRLTKDDTFAPIGNTVIVLTPSLHRGVLPALEYARGLSTDVRAVHIDTDPIDAKLLEDRWDAWGGGIPLIILESPYRSLILPLLQYLEEAKTERQNHLITVVIPEFVPAKWWHKILHNQSGFILKFVLLFRKDIVTANVRYYVEE